MNQAVANKLRQGIAIALKQFPWLRDWDKESGIYLWERHNEDGKYCWYIGKAKNIIWRTAQHIIDGKSHLDLSIKDHKFYDKDKNTTGWQLRILLTCPESDLDYNEQLYIKNFQELYPDSRMYNVESGGTTGKTIIGEKKQRRDVKWKAEARAKVLAEYREYFDIVPKDNAYKKNGYNELKAEPEKLKGEYYENSNQ